MDLNCPNCGAPLGFADHCEYCGTWVADFTIDEKKPFYIRIRVGDTLKIAKVVLETAEMHYDSNDIHLYADNTVQYVIQAPEITYFLKLRQVGLE